MSVENPQGDVSGLFRSPVILPHILDELPMGVMVMDTERRVLLMNRALEVLCGFTSDDVRHAPCRDVLRCDQCRTNCLAMEAAENRCPVTRKCTIITREREKKTVSVTTAPLFSPSGEQMGFIETVQDIADLSADPGSPDAQLQLGSIIGSSRKMEDLFRIVPVVSQTDSSVLITGETGTGKDLLAEIIHRNSDRSDGPFIKINCGSLPENLLESELFGHTKGAFTGAVADKQGRFRLAHNGTVFLTEIGDLPLSLQVKLLTFLDDKVVYPLGSAKGFQADVRVIAATHRNLEQMVREGQFRQDLLYRLNVVRLSMPPLREREGDVALLMDHFLKVFRARFSKPPMTLSPEVHDFLLHHTYPGNVRELRNIMEYAVNICQSGLITQDHLPAYLLQQEEFGPEPAPPAGPAGPAGTAETHPTPLQRTQPPQTKVDPAANWSQVERGLILDALVQSGGRKGEAAKILGWGRSTLWRKMKQHGIEE